MYPYEFRIISSLEKVLPTEDSLPAPRLTDLSGMRGERVSFQVAYRYTESYYLSQVEKQGTRNPSVLLRPKGFFKDALRLRKVRCVPVMTPFKSHYDDDYISLQAGVFPDILEDFDGWVQCIPHQWRAVWLDVEIPADCPGGRHEVALDILNGEMEPITCLRLQLTVVAALPPQKLIHTNWLHPDCLVDYYGYEAFSQEHWDSLESFTALAVQRGINTALVPLFTLPLDTLIGKERTTVQLVDVWQNEDRSFRFGFEKVERFIRMCQNLGVEWFEMSHLFSQWGAKYPCKVVAQTPEGERVIYGWDKTVAESDYGDFLAALLPQLVEELRRLGVAQHCFFHISDEPNVHNQDTYEAAKNIVTPYLAGIPVVDALSHIELYQKGIVEHPAPTNTDVHDFIDAKVPGLWVYHCCDQGNRVANRFIAMPAYRNRILGVQLYKYALAGFLHWGYNFYSSQYCLRNVDPYQINDSDDAFPAGDPFIVYPGADGRPVESMRLPVVSDAMDDLRAFQMLESLTSKDFVMELIEEGLEEPIRFDRYPRSAAYILALRERVNREIEKRLDP